ncbi:MULTISPECIES: hypothetical protein [Halobacterium]|uniref:hypothetical protein n=1 Tax=Halobacterium TaxID=2239 RepID=UPI00073F9D54|nr:MULTISPECIES: hypothetical protein [Halobacterium]MCG1003184.1 hypothetical protein [Halobacterium noricense]
MTRYEPVVEDDTLVLVADTRDDRVEIGTVDDVVAAMGGDTHPIEYDQKQRKQPWLDTDGGVLDVDVHEAVTTLPHTPETVAEVRDYGMDTERYGLPRRTVEFANELVDILEQQGKHDPETPE